MIFHGAAQCVANANIQWLQMSWDNYALATNKNDVEQTNMCNAHNSTQCNQINCFSWNKHLNRTKRQVIHSFEMRLSFNANADVLLRTNTLHLPSEYIPNCLARSFYWHKNKPKWSHSFFLFVWEKKEEKKNMIKNACYQTNDYRGRS